jgi:hypothetical protein
VRWMLGIPTLHAVSCDASESTGNRSSDAGCEHSRSVAAIGGSSPWMAASWFVTAFAACVVPAIAACVATALGHIVSELWVSGQQGRVSSMKRAAKRACNLEDSS